MKLFKKLVAFAVGGILVLSTGCVGPIRPNSDPIDPYDNDGFNLLTPYEGGDIIDVDEEEVEAILEEELGEGAANAVRDFLGEYLYDYTLEHSHMDADELGKFVTLFVELSDGDEPAEIMTAIADKIPDVEMDRLLATLIEIKNDEQAFSDFHAVLTDDGDYQFGSGPRPTYQNANKILNGADADIASMAGQEASFRSANIAFYNDWYADDLLDVLLTEEGIYFIRFAQNALRSMKDELNESELIYTLCKLFDSDFGDSFDTAERYVMRHFDAYLNNLGKAIQKANISTNSWAAVYGLLEKVMYYMSALENVDTQSFVKYSRYSEMSANIKNLFLVLNPKGLNVLVNFAGKIGEELPANTVRVEEREKDHEIRYDFYFAFSTMASTFNKLYGELSADDKAAMEEATGTLGFQLSDFALALDDRGGTGDEDDFFEIFEATIGESIEIKFGLGDYVCGHIDDNLFTFRQNSNITASDIEDILNVKNVSVGTRHKGTDGSYFPDGKHVKNFKIIDGLDLSKPGQQLLHIKFDYYTQGQQKTDDFVIVCTVVPSDVSKFATSFYYNYAFTHVVDEQTVTDYLGNWVSFEGFEGMAQKFFVDKDYDDHETENEYHSVYFDGLYGLYAFDGKSFNDLYDYSPEVLSVKLGQLDYSERGLHCYPTGIEYHGGLFPVFFYYEVV